MITLSLGEPQHPVPAFVGPVLAKHIADFGRYPIAKGIEPFRRAVANWLSTRFQLPRPIDPESEILVLNGSREGLFFAAITAARYVGPRKGRPAILMPNPFYPAYGAGARAAGCEPIYLPTTRRQRIPAGSRCARRGDCWRARSRCSSPRPPIRKARSPRATISPA